MQSFRGCATEISSFPQELAELALAQKINAAQRHKDAIEKRRAMMTAWANYAGAT